MYYKFNQILQFRMHVVKYSESNKVRIMGSKSMRNIGLSTLTCVVQKINSNIPCIQL